MSSLTYCPVRVKRALDALAAGNTSKAAAAAAGVHYHTFLSWKREFPEFEEQCTLAVLEAERTAVQYIREAMATQWTAAAWWLERRSHDDWRRRDHQEITATIQQVTVIEAVRPQIIEGTAIVSLPESVPDSDEPGQDAVSLSSGSVASLGIDA